MSITMSMNMKMILVNPLDDGFSKSDSKEMKDEDCVKKTGK